MHRSTDGRFDCVPWSGEHRYFPVLRRAQHHSRGDGGHAPYKWRQYRALGRQFAQQCPSLREWQFCIGRHIEQRHTPCG